MAAARSATQGEVAVLLVESGLWARYRVEDGGAHLVESHIECPTADDSIVLTGEAVLAALADGRVALDEAQSRRLLVEIPPGLLIP